MSSVALQEKPVRSAPVANTSHSAQPSQSAQDALSGSQSSTRCRTAVWHENIITQDRCTLTPLGRKQKRDDIPAHLSRAEKIALLLPIAESFRNRWQSRPLRDLTITPEDIYQIAAVAIVEAVDDYREGVGTLRGHAYLQSRFAVASAHRSACTGTRSMYERGESYNIVSFSDIPTESYFVSTLTSEDEALREILGDVIEEAIEQLPERERYVFAATVMHTDSQKQIGQRIGGLSQSRVSYLKKQAMIHLASALAPFGALSAEDIKLPVSVATIATYHEDKSL